MPDQVAKVAGQLTIFLPWMQDFCAKFEQQTDRYNRVGFNRSLRSVKARSGTHPTLLIRCNCLRLAFS